MLRYSRRWRMNDTQHTQHDKIVVGANSTELFDNEVWQRGVTATTSRVSRINLPMFPSNANAPESVALLDELIRIFKMEKCLVNEAVT